MNVESISTINLLVPGKGTIGEKKRYIAIHGAHLKGREDLTNAFDYTQELWSTRLKRSGSILILSNENFVRMDDIKRKLTYPEHINIFKERYEFTSVYINNHFGAENTFWVNSLDNNLTSIKNLSYTILENLCNHADKFKVFHPILYTMKTELSRRQSTASRENLPDDPESSAKYQKFLDNLKL